MSLQLAQKSYRRAEQADQNIPDDAHAVIGVALTELQAARETLSVAAEASRPLSSSAMTKAMSSIYLLQSSLDFERGGEIAPALFQVYEYCRQHLISAFRNEAGSDAGLTQAAQFIRSLREAWSGMAKPA